MLRDESGVGEVSAHIVFETCHLLYRTGMSFTVCVPPEIIGQSVEVHHSCEPTVCTSILLHPQRQIGLQLRVGRNTAPKDSRLPPACRDAMSVNEDAPHPEFRSKDGIYECLFGLTFYDGVQPDHREGLPPRTFFSHNSERVYSSSHSESSESLSRRNFDSLPLRSVTTIS